MRFQNFDQENEMPQTASAGEWSGETLGNESSFGAQEMQAETQEMELAAELLGVINESELEQFLGGLLSRVTGAAGSFFSSPAGQQIQALLKSAAKQALPKIGGAIGNHFGGVAGSQVGQKIGEGASRLFGLELEGLSGEDREFEIARQFVRFASDAATGAARPNGSAFDARNAYLGAARQYAPGLLAPNSHPQAARPSLKGFPATGRWIRNGQSVVLM